MKSECDIVLIGAGVMSATLGVLLKELEPEISIEIFERLDDVALESSAAWNNAGTGHSALCELNYTPELEDGSIDISKAIKIAESFEVSKQFWAYLTQKSFFNRNSSFIHSIPHMSLVWGEADVNFLRKRHAAMIQCPLFESMEWSDDERQLSEWIPLVMSGAQPQPMAATRITVGTDVNFGDLTERLFSHLKQEHGVELHLNCEVQDLKKEGSSWNTLVTNGNGEVKNVESKFVFVGAGGGALRLLEKSEIEEVKGYGGFPISGQWLACKNRSLIEKHHAKVYGKAAIGAPPMSVPHLDTRVIDGKQELLFGPFAGFSTKFLKEGSLLDLISSVTKDNLIPLLGAGVHNLPLTKYLIEQLSMSFDEKMDTLRTFIPGADNSDWELAVAGQRVQVIKKDEEAGGILEFGTEVVASADHSIAGLLGASPGASTSVSIMIGLLQKMFPEKMSSGRWQAKLKEMIPSFGKELAGDAELTRKTRIHSHAILGLQL